MHPIRRSNSIFDLPSRELFRVFLQGVGFCGLAYLVLAVLGFLPASLNVFTPMRAEPAAEVKDDSYELPEAPVDARGSETSTVPSLVSIPKIGVEAEIHVPPSIDVETLDRLLSLGAVYYPGSGVVERGNVFIFGHSSNWAIVKNQAYKTFNNLEDLVPGDLIYLSGEGWEAAYEVESVRVAPDSEVLVSFSGSEPRLTLSTCNTFGLKEERIVVEARAAGDIDYND
jgi:LPXTG-site transpeptidase (sortase) family protein